MINCAILGMKHSHIHYLMNRRLALLLILRVDIQYPHQHPCFHKGYALDQDLGPFHSLDRLLFPHILVQDPDLHQADHHQGLAAAMRLIIAEKKLLQCMHDHGQGRHMVVGPDMTAMRNTNMNG